MKIIRFWFSLIALLIIACNEKSENTNTASLITNEDAYAKWMFYVVNCHIETGVLLCPKFGVSSLNRKINLFKEIIISNKIEKNDTVVYHFFIYDSISKCIIEPREFWFPWIIVEKKTSSLLAIMGSLAKLEDYIEAVEGFHDFNLSPKAKYLPTGQRSPFPIENSEKEFISLLENQDNLKELNPWLYYYFNYVHKKQKLVWDTEILKDISGVIIEDKKRNPMMRVWLK